jgi:chromosomal replication initiation ATPase DnaA
VSDAEKVARIERRLHQQRALMWARSYCASQGATLTSVVVGTRHASVARARHRLWMVMRHTLGFSFPELGILFEVDHTTVMSGVKKCERALEAEHAGRAA